MTTQQHGKPKKLAPTGCGVLDMVPPVPALSAFAPPVELVDMIPPSMPLVVGAPGTMLVPAFDMTQAPDADQTEELNEETACVRDMEMQRLLYGEQVYVKVEPWAPNPDIAQKIAGMLLELPREELEMCLTDENEFRLRVDEAIDVLREDGITM